MPGRVGYPFRVLMVLMTLPFHAFLGITIMDQNTPLAGDYDSALREGPMGSWLPPMLEDQHLAGGILWATGDLFGLLLFLVLFTQWVRAVDERGGARRPSAGPPGSAASVSGR